MAKIEAGQFVDVSTGVVFDGYTDGDKVDTVLTKAGKFSQAHRMMHLARWSTYSRNGKFPLYRSNVARFDAETEAKAAPVRERIEAIKAQLEAAQEELAALYDYQAGPEPTTIEQAQAKS